MYRIHDMYRSGGLYPLYRRSIHTHLSHNRFIQKYEGFSFFGVQELGSGQSHGLKDDDDVKDDDDEVKYDDDCRRRSVETSLEMIRRRGCAVVMCRTTKFCIFLLYNDDDNAKR